MQDLHATSILPQMITLTEAYIQIYERRAPETTVKTEPKTEPKTETKMETN